MNPRQAIFIALLLMSCTYGNAQKQTSHVEQIWVGYFQQARISDQFGWWIDAHLRTREEFVSDFSTSVIRVALIWHANDHLRFKAGYAFVNHYPADDHDGVTQPEHRPWQQVQWAVNSKRSRLLQAIRLEERFRKKILDRDELADGYSFNYRIRYSTLLQLPLAKAAFAPGTLSGVLSNEVMVNFGKQIVNNYFDQNRLFVGFAYHWNNHAQIQFGYMNIFQQLAAGNKYRSVHVPRVYFFHNVDLRKNRKQ